MRNLILIRHGEAEHHVGGMTGGWTDLPLTERGRGQAAATGRFLARSAPFAARALISSDLARASQTGAILAEALGVPLETSPALRELNNGVAAGRTAAEARTLALPRTEPALDWIPYPGAESWRRLYARLAAFHDGLVAEGRDDVVVVSPANAMICLINRFLGLTSDAILTSLMYDLRPCSLTHLRADPDGERRVLRLNDVSHLVAVG